MTRILLASTAALALLACSASEDTTTTVETAPASVEASTKTKPASQTESERFNNWLARRFEEEAQNSPEFLAQLGRKERYGEWNDETKAGWLERMERVRDRVRRAKHSNAMAGVGPVAANVHLRAVYLDERLPPELWPPITDRFRDALVR